MQPRCCQRLVELGGIGALAAFDLGELRDDLPVTPIELTRLTKVGGPLTKRISLAADGTLLNDGAACVMSRGAAERIKVAGVAALARKHSGCTSVTPGKQSKRDRLRAVFWFVGTGQSEGSFP